MENRIKRTKFNIGILGSSRVGKTNLINADLNGVFIEDSLETYGIDTYDTKIIINGDNYRLKIFDTAGQERFHSISASIIKRCQIIIIVYDITNRKSFEESINWFHVIEENVGNRCIIGIIGNKIDLYDKKEVSEEEATEFAKSKNIPLFLTSAKTNPTNFGILINNLTEEYLRRNPEEERRSISLEIEENNKKRRKKGCCMGEIYYPFEERFKARVFPWYAPMFEFKERKKDSLIK